MVKNQNKIIKINRIVYCFVSLASVFLSLCIPAKAQEQLGLREKADRLYSTDQYAKAVLIYLKLADTKEPRLADLEHLAQCYVSMNDYEAAENWYSRVVEFPTSKVDNLVTYGKILKSNSKYKEARDIFRLYADKSGDSKRVATEIAGCDSAELWIPHPTSHKIRNEAAINTDLSEFGTFISGGKVFYAGETNSTTFNETDGRSGHSFLKVYAATLTNDNKLDSASVYQASFNKDKYHVGPLIGNNASNTLFLTRTYTGKDGEVNADGKFQFRSHNLGLYILTKDGNQWNEKPFAYTNVQQYSLGHAALSLNEKILYFVSDMPGGLGGTDIWYSELQSDGEWGGPVNAGSAINSEGDEMFPNISSDGVLYYSSNGLIGIGGLDIFSARGEKSNWSLPINMKFPLNSSKDDFAFITVPSAVDLNSGFFSSNRNGGKGSDDIYSFNSVKSKIVLSIKGIVLNKKTSEILDSAVISLLTNGRQLVTKKYSNKEGIFYLELDPGKEYTVLGQKQKFYSDSAFLSTNGVKTSDTISVTLKLDPLFELAKTLEIKNIHYDFNMANIRKDAAEILDELVRIMHDNSTLEIELGSHTDSRGADAYNLELSQRRAQSAINYLVSKGISRSRMTFKGYGETKLVNRCENGIKCSIAEHQQNRRTEIKILKY